MLPSGQHTLTTQPDNDDVFKHCILVKLTESSTQAIEDYLRNKDHTNKRPSIVFQKDKGEICFPISSNNSGFKKFHIAISSVKEAMKQDTSASVECVAFNNSQFKKLGTIESKMTVQAIKDEVFQATMEKVNNVKEEEKNNSTREIKHSGAIVNRSSTNANLNNTTSLNNSRAKQIAASIVANNKSKTPVNDRPLKERIIHLLALKPYMKPELMLRLKKDNPLTEREGEQLDSIIQSVGIMNQKNQYELISEIMLNEVKEDWPFYSSADKLIVKRNIANFKQKQNNLSLNTSANSKLNSSLNSNKQYSSSAFSSISSSSNAFNKSNLDDKKNSPLKSSMEGSSNGKVTPNFLKQKAPMHKSSISPNSPEENNNKNYQEMKRLKPNGNINNHSYQRDDSTQFFSKKYKPIQTKQQLKQYTLEFDQNHKEYSELYEFLAPTAKQFDEYQKELGEIGDQNSKEAAEKKETILKVYFEKKNDQEFTKRRERYDYLDLKLNYLKDLINQYKEKNEPLINLSPFSP